MKHKSLKKNNRYEKLFHRYTKKDYLTLSQIKKLMKQELKLSYNLNIMNSLMNIWGTMINHKKVITKQTFPKLFKKPDGFFRDIVI